MSEPCAHEREFAGTQADTLTSFIKTSGELVKVTAQRDAARIEAADCKSLAVAVIERLTTERDAVLATLARVREVTAALDRIYVKAAEDAEVGYRGAGDYADAYKYATGLLHAALEPTP